MTVHNNDDDPDPSHPDPFNDDRAREEHSARPPANTGRHTPIDDLRNDDLKNALAQYGDAYTVRGAGEANMIRGLAAGYEIALERAKTEISQLEDDARIAQDKVFAWHFTSILGEFAVGSHDSERSLRNRAHDAFQLVEHFPEWLVALEDGRIDMRHVRAMLQHTRALDPEHHAGYGAQVLEFAEFHTATETKRYAEQIAGTLAAENFEAAHVRARAERHVSIVHDGLGMATLYAYLPSEVAAPIEQLLDRRVKELRAIDQAAAEEHREAARAAHRAGLVSPAEYLADTRTSPQMKADIFAETLLCATPGESNVKAVVSVVIPAMTLLNDRKDGSQPALLDGMVPMSSTEARRIAGTAQAFQRVLTDPVTGQVTGVDAYQPDRNLRRFLQSRDVHCRFPGCVKPVATGEIDHTTPYSEGGDTNTANLGFLCKGHHVQKHEKPWTVTNLGGGVLEWRTPLGQVATTQPEPVGLRFHPTNSPSESGPRFGLATDPDAESDDDYPPL